VGAVGAISAATVQAMTLLHFDSITVVPPTLRGKAVLAASHGGTYVAQAALALGLGGLIVSDAGIGRERAGVAGLDTLEGHGVPAAAVSVHSARIGDGADCLQRGVISCANETARSIGVVPGMAAQVALQRMAECAREPVGTMPDVGEDRREERQSHGARIIIADSNSMVGPGDAGSIFVTGSHGGLLGGRAATAVKAPVAAAVYNDADGGIDGAGFSRLAALDARGIAAATVSAWSARIGDGLSTFEDGYITHINDCAAAAGGEVGISCEELVARLIRWLRTKS
jgi:hypothetical protein